MALVNKKNNLLPYQSIRNKLSLNKIFSAYWVIYMIY